MKSASLGELELQVGYQFQNPDLLIEALTHSSFIKESASAGRDNERMEFLGDAVLNFLVTVHLVEVFPEASEGELSRARAGLVSARHLSKVARALGLGRYLHLGASEERTGGREKEGLAANAVEALIAAHFLDGGIKAARGFVEEFILPRNVADSPTELSVANFKGSLQEYLQARRLPAAQYRVTESSGAEHQKLFTVEVHAAGRVLAQGTGASKKAAEQEAARAALARISEESDG